jgi:hypothetical protein
MDVLKRSSHVWVILGKRLNHGVPLLGCGLASGIDKHLLNVGAGVEIVSHSSHRCGVRSHHGGRRTRIRRRWLRNRSSGRYRRKDARRRNSGSRAAHTPP